jgi:hypothetical protein
MNLAAKGETAPNQRDQRNHGKLQVHVLGIARLREIGKRGFSILDWRLRIAEFGGARLLTSRCWRTAIIFIYGSRGRSPHRQRLGDIFIGCAICDTPRPPATFVKLIFHSFPPVKSGLF